MKIYTTKKITFAVTAFLGVLLVVTPAFAQTQIFHHTGSAKVPLVHATKHQPTHQILHGTVTAVGTNSITISSGNKKKPVSTTVTTTSATLFQGTTGASFTLSDIQTGDRVTVQENKGAVASVTDMGAKTTGNNRDTAVKKNTGTTKGGKN